MRALLTTLLLCLGCGPVEQQPPFFTARAGDPCPGYGRAACDGPCQVLCLTDDAGVWTVARCSPRCGAGLTVSGGDVDAGM